MIMEVLQISLTGQVYHSAKLAEPVCAWQVVEGAGVKNKTVNNRL